MSGRTHLAAWLFRSLRSLVPAHPRGKYGAHFAPQPRLPRRFFSFVAGNKHLHHFNVSFGHCSTYFFFPRIDAYSPVASRISQGQKHRAVKKGEIHYTKLHSPILHGYCFTELIKISISNPFVHLRQQSKNISLFLLITRTAFL